MKTEVKEGVSGSVREGDGWVDTAYTLPASILSRAYPLPTFTGFYRLLFSSFDMFLVVVLDFLSATRSRVGR